ncbi:hypothetical protein [Vitiosangium sp. GDMCC 1.1324]|uniref:hypothetical protein n=1 Tax=Vitiosangium sp. (strain GDMCC 1.1324) TaxID=2138576 RepID=UPI00130E00CB|nr:hypothetical protein [Vitiosangium sp. GDMCC 1.1324]
MAQGVSVGVSNFRHYGLLRPSEEATTLEAAYQRALGTEGLGQHLFLGGGLRFALPSNKVNFPLEVFARGELRTRLGFWEPAGGLEFGYSQVALPWQTLRIPFAKELFAAEDARTGPLYFAIHAAPLRFHFGRFVVGAFEVQWGPVGPPFGTVQRLHVGLARVEMQL